jgi:hypothetical protein
VPCQQVPGAESSWFNVPRPRPQTDLYLATVEEARRSPGQWIEVPRTFDTEFNASITGFCLREGYLRVKPRPGEPAVRVAGNSYLATAGPVEVDYREIPEGWVLFVRG